MNGIILINKEKGYTSHDIVAIVKKITKQKVGHTGTLDPMATGVLPLLIGSATQISKYLINHNKTYIATLKLGERTDTLDAEGIVIETQSIPELNEDIVKKELNSLIGKQEQIPPMYSAIKVKGKKLYEYAREGKTIEVAPREIEIYNTKLICFNKEQNEIKFEISSSKGTYIRTICETLAQKLQTVGYMKELERVQVGQFNIEEAIKISEVKENNNILESHIIPLEKFFENKEKIELTEAELKMFLNGVLLNKTLSDEIYRIYFNNKFIGLGICNNNMLKRDIVEG